MQLFRTVLQIVCILSVNASPSFSGVGGFNSNSMEVLPELVNAEDIRPISTHGNVPLLGLGKNMRKRNPQGSEDSNSSRASKASRASRDSRASRSSRASTITGNGSNQNNSTGTVVNNNNTTSLANNNNSEAGSNTNNSGVESKNTGSGGAANGPAFCNGQTLGDGTQQQGSTCSVTVQGSIPAVENMVSTLITSPDDGAVISAGAEVTVSVITLNMDLGFFDNPQTQYYSTPQTLNGQGIIQGHQHISVQKVGNGNAPLNPNPSALTFFQGLDGQDNNGVLQTVIPAGTLTEPGTYRFCTITGTRAHQPVIMPVARRGAQDDCIRVTVQ